MGDGRLHSGSRSRSRLHLLGMSLPLLLWWLWWLWWLWLARLGGGLPSSWSWSTRPRDSRILLEDPLDPFIMRHIVEVCDPGRLHIGSVHPPSRE
jgi:hypothetical protein